MPDLKRLRTVKQLCADYPDIFTEGSLRWLIYNKQRNKFDRCIIRIGRRLYIDLEALKAWLEHHRDVRLNSPPNAGNHGGRQVHAL